MNSGVYQILNTVNGKIYIGSAVDFEARWRVHRSELRNNKHANKHLQNSYNRHGSASFEYFVVERCPSSEMTAKEQFWMNATGVVKNGYNICPDARNMLGFKHSAETKRKVSLLQRGIRKSVKTEFKKGMVPWNKGRPTGKGYKHTEEAKRKISEARKVTKASETARQNMSAAKKGKKRSPEHIYNSAEARRVYTTFRGETLCVIGWAEKVGVDPRTMAWRLRNWTVERALTTPNQQPKECHGQQTFKY